MKPKEFHSKLEDKRIVEAIAKAELRTTGEIRVFISHHEVADALSAGLKEFERLGMRSTKQRNGVLLYFAPVSHKFAIVGDQGIHERCGDEFWEGVKQAMQPLLKQGQFTEAVLTGIERLGEVLARHFPGDGSGSNELSNQIETD